MRCLSRIASILKNKSLMVVPIAAVLAAVYWWQTVLAVLLGMVKLVFGMILYNLLRVVIVAALLLFVVRYGGYWLWRKLTGREAGPFRIRPVQPVVFQTLPVRGR